MFLFCLYLINKNYQYISFNISVYQMNRSFYICTSLVIFKHYYLRKSKKLPYLTKIYNFWSFLEESGFLSTQILYVVSVKRTQNIYLKCWISIIQSIIAKWLFLTKNGSFWRLWQTSVYWLKMYIGKMFCTKGPMIQIKLSGLRTKKQGK